MEKLGEWHRGKYCEFLKLPPEIWQGKSSTLEKVSLDSMKSVFEEKPVISHKTYHRGRKKKKKILKVNPKEDQRNMCSSIQENVTVSEIKNGIDYENLGYQLAENYLSWPDLVRSVAFMKVSLQQRNFADENLKSTPKTLSEAQEAIFFICQKPLREDKDMTKKRFRKFDPIKDSKGLIRANGRLSQVDLPEEVEHPILLPGEHPLTHLLAIRYHHKLLHQGYRVVLANLSNIGIVIGKGRELLKSIANRCMFCRIRGRKCLEQEMGSLPAFRIQPRMPPFTSVAVDFFGNQSKAEM